MRQEDVAKAALVREFRGTKLSVLPIRGDPIFTTETIAESEKLCNLIAKLYEKREDTAKAAASTFFLTLLTNDGAEKRCAGLFYDAGKVASCLSEESTENGYYTLAVIEKVVQAGYWPKLEAVRWWRWTGSLWQEMPMPEDFEKVRNFAIS